MVKSATVVRDDKQGAQPAKAVEKANKSAARPPAKTANQAGSGLAVLGAGNPITGLFSRSATFLKDVRSELRKVVTPSKEEVRSMTTVVIVTVFAIAAYFYVVDGVLGHVIQAILHFLGGTQ